MGYAFISYSTKNQASADAVRQLFKRHNIDTWMAPYDIPAGSKYAAVITRGIRDCSCFVLLLSNDSQASEAVDSEVELATLTFKKTIITIELEDVVLNDAFTFYIHNKQIIPVHNLDENSYGIKQVLDAVSVHTRESEEVSSVAGEPADKKDTEVSTDSDNKLIEEAKGTAAEAAVDSTATEPVVEEAVIEETKPEEVNTEIPKPEEPKPEKTVPEETKPDVSDVPETSTPPMPKANYKRVAVINCQYCGAVNSADASYCKACSKAFKKQPPKAQRQDRPVSVKNAPKPRNLGTNEKTKCFCPSCGISVSESTKYCPCCHSAIKKVPYGQGKPDTKSVLAPTPVAEQKKICSKCGTSVKSYASYCPACGSKFS